LASENLFSAGYDFQIAGSQGNGSLIFRPSFDVFDPLNASNQTNSEQSVLSPDPYVFAGDTDDFNFFAVRDPSETRLQGGDSTFSFADVSLNSTQRLLARLELQHVTGTPLSAIGDTFTLSLINDDAGTPGDVDDDSTLFFDSGFTPLAFETGSDPSAFTNFGTITITSAAAVPEPSTFAFLAIAAVGFAGRRLRKKKAENLQAESSELHSQG